MLKISKAESSKEQTVLQLEGKVSGCWIEEMERACDLALKEGGLVRLDLANVTFADRNGVKALLELKKRKVTLANCSLFLTEQLKAVRDE